MAVPGTKFRAPALRRQLVPRERLLNLASATTSMPRLLLIAAPAGFGKTTLLSQWLATGLQVDDRHPSLVAWVALDDGDAEVGQFLTNLTTAIRGVGDGVGEEALALLTTHEHCQLRKSSRASSTILTKLTGEPLSRWTTITSLILRKLTMRWRSYLITCRLTSLLR